jgi:hypothetical protein
MGEKRFDFKNLDAKSIFIIILAIALILSFLFNIHNSIVYPKDEIKKLREANEILSKKNDSVFLVNKGLDKKLAELGLILKNNDKKLAETESELKQLKKKKNETPNYVNRLSASGVATALSEYLDKTTKSKNSR